MHHEMGVWPPWSGEKIGISHLSDTQVCRLEKLKNARKSTGTTEKAYSSSDSDKGLGRQRVWHASLGCVLKAESDQHASGRDPAETALSVCSEPAT